jgi:uncharacterized protein
VEPDAVEIRVLGSLIEKQRTTPDAYPLSLNALRLACNQATNRDPVVDFDDADVREALHRLGPRGWTRGANDTGRATKYRHILDEALGLAPDELAVLCVLMLRGAQTAGEINQRTARMQDFADLAAVEDTIIRLADRELLEPLELQPGQKEVRFRHLLEGSEGAETPPVSEPRPADVGDVPPTSAPPAPLPTSTSDRPTREEVDALRAEIADVRSALDDLRRQLGA